MDTESVTCSECGHDAEIAQPDDPSVEVRWLCDDPDCKHLNVIEGHQGEPGEAAFNPAATALTDEQIMEAAERRGLIHSAVLGGGASMSGGGSAEAVQ